MVPCLVHDEIFSWGLTGMQTSWENSHHANETRCCWPSSNTWTWQRNHRVLLSHLSGVLQAWDRLWARVVGKRWDAIAFAHLKNFVLHLSWIPGTFIKPVKVILVSCTRYKTSLITSKILIASPWCSYIRTLSNFALVASVTLLLPSVRILWSAEAEMMHREVNICYASCRDIPRYLTYIICDRWYFKHKLRRIFAYEKPWWMAVLTQRNNYV
jgi:hypothetical protein